MAAGREVSIQELLEHLDAIKNAKFVNAEMPWNSKKKTRGNYKEATFTLEIQVPDMSGPTNNGDLVALYAGEPSKVPMKTVQIKYSPAGYAEYNNFMSLTGRDDLMVGTTREGAKEIAERNQRGAGFNND